MINEIKTEELDEHPSCMRMFAKEFILAGGRISYPLKDYYRFVIRAGDEEKQAGLDRYEQKWSVVPFRGDSSEYLSWQEAELCIKRELGWLTR